MRIALVADTHLPRFGRALPKALEDGMRSEGIERILHAGDFTTSLAADLLEAIAPLDAVAGNNDGPELVRRFGARKVVELDGVRIGLFHGHLGRGRTTPERARATFVGEPDLGAIVFGHSHIPLIERLPDGRWLVNPGSPTDRRRQPRYSWAVLETEAGRIARVELRTYDSRAVALDPPIAAPERPA